MFADIVYSTLVLCTWFFLGGWILVLLLASAAAFREELSEAWPGE
ncbi:MAG: hypothetical protein ACRD2U_03610 [Terriglobales bacterium]